ncbi:MAG: hypothetical protein OXI01_01400 [Albidovulum sp.]|nr:hypothetical protein [Albidovulum sp.]
MERMRIDDRIQIQILRIMRPGSRSCIRAIFHARSIDHPFSSKSRKWFGEAVYNEAAGGALRSRDLALAGTVQVPEH